MSRILLTCVALAITVPVWAADVGVSSAAQGSAGALSPDAVVIRGPAGQVSLAELRLVVDEQITPSKRQAFWNNPKSVSDMARNLYARRALAQQAVKEGLERQPANEVYLKLWRERALAESMLQARERARVADSGVIEQISRTAYIAEPKRYTRPEQVRLRDILVPIADDDKDGLAALQRAEALLAQLNKGASFEQLAREHSSDRNSGIKDGDLGLADVGLMMPGFEAAAASLKPGEFTGPVRMKDGYHIIKLVERLPAGLVSYEEAAPFIRAETAEKLGAEERRKVWEATLSSDAVRVDEAVLRELALPGTRPLKK